MSEENVEMRRVWELWEEEGPDKGNLVAAWDHGLAAPDATINPPREMPSADRYVGRQGFLDFIGVWTEAFDDWAIGAERFIDAGENQVILLVRQTATGKASGAPVEFRFPILYTLQQGQITRLDMFATEEQALEAAGLAESGDD